MSNKLIPLVYPVMPSDPPVVHGFEFRPIEDGLWFGEVSEEAAEHLLRAGFKPFGGAAPSNDAPDTPAGEGSETSEGGSDETPANEDAAAGGDTPADGEAKSAAKSKGKK